MRRDSSGQRWYWMAIAVLLIILWMPNRATPCTTFLLTDGNKHVVGKSYDYGIGYGHVLFNKRGAAKMALVAVPGAKPASWVSSHSSLTFNQFGRELPQSGMNEKGLVVEIMWLDRSSYPQPDTRPAINELQWIQYQLDTRATVKEIVEHAKELTVLPVYGKVHFLACDRTGKCAAFEYLDGKLVITPPEQMKVNTLTNNSYADSTAFLVKHRGFGGKQPVPRGKGSLERFVRASALGRKLSRKPGHRVKQAFKILDSVSQGDFTKWNLVYDLDRLRVHFRTRGHWKIKVIDFKSFDKSCKTPVQELEMNTDLSGSVTKRFSDYDSKKNKILVKKSLAGIRLNLPPILTESIANFPELFQCTLQEKEGQNPQAPSAK